MTITLPITVRPTSDWAIGSGTARHAAIDRRVRRDVDGLPFIPGRTLKGMLREAVTLAARALDDGARADWSHLGETLFGSAFGTPTSQGVLTTSSARMTPELRASLAASPELTRATVFLRSSTALDENGVALEDTLRVEERARAGSRLVGTLTLDVDPEWWAAHGWAVRVLLRAGSTLLDRVGGKRRRGSGRIEVHIEGLGGDEEFKGLLEKANTDQPPIPPRSSAGADVSTTPCAETDVWRAYEVHVTSVDPLLLVSRTVGNTAEALNHIPGSHLLSLLGHLDGRTRNAVANGDLVVGNAYPAVRSERYLPAPLSLHVRKVSVAGDNTVVDVMRSAVVDESGAPIQTVPLRGFVLPGSAAGAVSRVSAPATVSTTHVRIDRESQRAEDEALFTYQALAPGQAFRAEVLVRGNAVDVDRLDGRHRIGASRSAEYGGIEVTVQPRAERRDAGDIPAGHELIVWLTSDVVLPTGGATAEALRSALSDALGTELVASVKPGWPSAVAHVAAARAGSRSGACRALRS